MIAHCLSNKNENATVSKSKKFLDVNKALIQHIFPPSQEERCYGMYVGHFKKNN